MKDYTVVNEVETLQQVCTARACVCVCVEYMCVCASVCKVGVCLPGGYGDNAAIKNSSPSTGVSGRREGR